MYDNVLQQKGWVNILYQFLHMYLHGAELLLSFIIS
jgi:hypothetical protein